MIPLPSSSAELVLVRHGQTASNCIHPDPLISGWTDLPLTVSGERQVELLRKRFETEPAAAALYSSPLQRARATADGVAATTGLSIRLRDDLREINCGKVDGLPISLVRRFHAELWARNLLQTDEHFRWPDGESYCELRERSLTALDRIAAKHAGQRVLVVTHAGVISQVIGSLFGRSPASWEPFRPHNTSLTRLRWSTTSREVLVFDDYRHLGGAPELVHETNASRHRRAG
jgi:broad specificity phosphatase PhoE